MPPMTGKGCQGLSYRTNRCSWCPLMKEGGVEVWVGRNWLAAKVWVIMSGEGLVIQFLFKMPTFEMSRGGSVRREELIGVLGLSYGISINSWYNLVFMMPISERGEVEVCQGLSLEWGGPCDTVFVQNAHLWNGWRWKCEEELISVLGLSYGMGINSRYNLVFMMPIYERGKVWKCEWGGID